MYSAIPTDSSNEHHRRRKMLIRMSSGSMSDGQSGSGQSSHHTRSYDRTLSLPFPSLHFHYEYIGVHMQDRITKNRPLVWWGSLLRIRSGLWTAIDPLMVEFFSLFNSAVNLKGWSHLGSNHVCYFHFSPLCKPLSNCNDGRAAGYACRLY